MAHLTIRCLFLSLLLSSLSCKEEVKKQLYFRDLVPPVGMGKVIVVSDESLNLPTGGQVTVLIAIDPDLDKEELDILMDSFYRQVKERRGFQKGDHPEKIDLRFYTSEASARNGRSDWLAQVLWTSGTNKPVTTNKQKAPLLKWATKALGNQPQFSGQHKPQILANPDLMTIDITVPFVADDGSGNYVENLTYTKAMTEFVSYTWTLFGKIPTLNKLTFMGKHNDQIVMKIWLTNEQFKQLGLQQVEESLGAFQGQFIELLMTNQVKEKVVEEKLKKQRRKVYREVLARLPQDQVELEKSLR